MEKEFVTYPLALRLKELGFDEPCMYAWCITPKHLREREGDLFLRTDGNPFGDFFTGKNWNVSYNNNKNKIKCSAPLFQQAFRWFREKYNLKDEYGVFPHHTIMFNYIIGGGKEEEAELACLEKLIELVEQKEK